MSTPGVRQQMSPSARTGSFRHMVPIRRPAVCPPAPPDGPGEVTIPDAEAQRGRSEVVGEEADTAFCSGVNWSVSGCPPTAATDRGAPRATASRRSEGSRRRSTRAQRRRTGMPVVLHLTRRFRRRAGVHRNAGSVKVAGGQPVQCRRAGTRRPCLHVRVEDPAGAGTRRRTDHKGHGR